jgi:hypothetical protein
VLLAPAVGDDALPRTHAHRCARTGELAVNDDRVARRELLEQRHRVLASVRVEGPSLGPLLASAPPARVSFAVARGSASRSLYTSMPSLLMQ